MGALPGPSLGPYLARSPAISRDLGAISPRSPGLSMGRYLAISLLISIMVAPTPTPNPNPNPNEQAYPFDHSPDFAGSVEGVITAQPSP